MIYKDLVFHERAEVSRCMTAVLERVARSEQAALLASAIGCLVKYNIPRFLRLTDAVNADTYGKRAVNPFLQIV